MANHRCLEKHSPHCGVIYEAHFLAIVNLRKFIDVSRSNCSEEVSVEQLDNSGGEISAEQPDNRTVVTLGYLAGTKPGSEGRVISGAILYALEQVRLLRITFIYSTIAFVAHNNPMM